MIKNKNNNKYMKKITQKNMVTINPQLDSITNHPAWLLYFRLTFEYHAHYWT